MPIPIETQKSSLISMKVPTHVCIKCGLEKSISNFEKDKRLKKGIKGRCKECSREFVERPHARLRRLRQSSESMNRSKKAVTDNYVIRQLCHHNDLTPADVRKFPELIAAKKQIIITNRIIKNEKKNKKHKQPS